jgi:hypothetical protein
MSIPDTITADHVRQALEALDHGEPHSFGEPTRYQLYHQGRYYPPKAVVGLAARFATGKALGPADFSSGLSRSQAVGFLRSLGFTDLPRSRRASEQPSLRDRTPADSSAPTDETGSLPDEGRHLLLYWKPATAAHQLADPEPLCRHAASEQLERAAVGDTLWIVTVRSGRLFLLGRLRVDAVTDRRGAARRLSTALRRRVRPGELWAARHHVVTNCPEPLQDLDLTADVGSLTFLGKSDHLPLEGGTVNPQRLQTMRVLTPETAEWLAKRWHAGLLSQEHVPDRPTRSGYVRDSAVRRAVELRAVEAATDHYSDRGYAVEDTSASEPYDLRCCQGGKEVRVEVKGSRGDGAEVLLTLGEVEHARRHRARCALFVWGHIRVVYDGPRPHGVGGRLVAHLTPWEPADSALTPTQFRYRLPSGAE